MTFPLTITTAGLDALVDAQTGVTAAIQVAEIGFSDEVFTVAPTLTALPGEVKRIASVSGAAISETIIHMTAQDSSQDAYDVRGFGLFLADGTLFAVYGQADPIVSKAPILNLQLAFDIAFQDAISGDIEFGDATFLFPPATETVKGVAEIATQAEVDEGEDDERIVTPLKLAARLAEAFGAIVSATETVEGVAEIATLAEALAGEDDDRIITPLKLAGVLEPVIAAIAEEVADRAAAIIAVEGQVDAEEAARIAGDATLSANIAAIAARTITGSGLATGGGSLAANRVIAVAAASVAQVRAGTASTAAITPSALGPFSKSLGTNGYCTIPTADPANTLLIQWGRFTAAPNGFSTVSFPIAFAQTFAVVVDGTSDSNANRQDNFPAVRDGSVTQTGFQVFNANDITDACNFIAIGRVDLS
jgi:hypothetical protein